MFVIEDFHRLVEYVFHERFGDELVQCVFEQVMNHVVGEMYDRIDHWW